MNTLFDWALSLAIFVVGLVYVAEMLQELFRRKP